MNSTHFSGSLAAVDHEEQIALGSAPEVRECPVCKHIGMRGATLCGPWWTKLTPPNEHDGAVG